MTGAGILRRSAAVALTLVFLNGCESDGRDVQVGEGREHFYVVARNGISVANPEFRFANVSWPGRPADEHSVRVAAEPQWARPGEEPYSVQSFDIYRNVRGSTLISPAGTSDIHKPVFPDTRMRRVLRQLGAEKQPDDSAGLLDHLGNGVAVTAVVELRTPMTSEQYESGYGVRGDNILISSGLAGDVPLYWDRTPACEQRRVARNCADLALFEEFRAWVALLRSADQSVLSAVGLQLPNLQEAAARGRIVGYVDDNTAPSELRLLLDDKRVRAVHIIDARLNCETSASMVCEPALW
ncbi:hypothetical protein [Nonomuraea harbinensis]|uniref:Lipoprotein n=1 Tax=Nonomuraea harbinensis TaxID=1286938 RepID=A0ABW1BUG6_9ACTN|nr:hypothetical protein [Nonomuraea harbinensis]